VSDRFIGKTALDLTKSDTPADIRAEAYWFVRADGNMGQRLTYAGEQNGIHIWQVNSNTQMFLRSKPAHMSEEDTAKLNRTMAWYNERQHEQMIDTLREQQLGSVI
jgi:hypothetical protein